MARYARGRKAWGECQRSGKRVLLRNMVEDGYTKGLLVAPDWYEGPHPQDEVPPRVDDPIAVYRPAPSNNHVVQEVRFPNYDLENNRVNGPLVLNWYLGAVTVIVDNEPADFFITEDGLNITAENGDFLILE